MKEERKRRIEVWERRGKRVGERYKRAEKRRGVL